MTAQPRTVGLMPGERLHALDSVRASAFILGVVLHATMSFAPGYGATGWPIMDDSPSPALSAMGVAIHVFLMPLFFTMSGFFARLMVSRRGARPFLEDRCKRILLPLVVGWIINMPLVVAAMYLALSQTGKPFVDLPPPPGTMLAIPLLHLWFLYFLMWLYVLFLAGRWLLSLFEAPRQWLVGSDAMVGWVMRTPLGALLPAAPVALVLYVSEATVPWLGVRQPDYSLIPNLPACVTYGVSFTFGWMLHRQPQLLMQLERLWVLNLSIAVALTIVSMQLGGTSPASSTPSLIGTDRAIYAGAYGGAVWFWTFALTGGALRYLSSDSPARRYLADASYWIYLTHLPLVFALQAVVMRWDVHWALKFPLIVTVTMLVLVVSYHYLVRSTVIGSVLNGRRYLRSPRLVPVRTLSDEA